MGTFSYDGGMDGQPDLRELLAENAELRRQVADPTRRLERLFKPANGRPLRFARVRPNPIPSRPAARVANITDPTAIGRPRHRIKSPTASKRRCPTIAHTVMGAWSRQKSRCNFKLRFPVSPSCGTSKFTSVITGSAGSEFIVAIRCKHQMRWVRFPQQAAALLTAATHDRNRCVRGENSLARLTDRRDKFGRRLEETLDRPRLIAEQATFAKPLAMHADENFAFVTDPLAETTNWQAEQQIRPAVVNRKVWGGNRSVAATHAQSLLMSVEETSRCQAVSALNHTSQTLRAFHLSFLPHPIPFATP